MIEQIVSFDTAVLAKEKGFDEKTISYYNLNKISYQVGDNIPFQHNTKAMYCYTAPSQSLLQKWLREVHKIFISIYSCDNNQLFNYNIQIGINDLCLPKSIGNKSVNTYEEALEAGLLEALNQIK